MKKHQNAGRIAARSDRPFPRHAANIDCSELHVVGYGPDRTDIVEAFSPLRPSTRSRFRTQQRADRVYFALSHCVLGRSSVCSRVCNQRAKLSAFVNAHTLAFCALKGQVKNCLQLNLRLLYCILIAPNVSRFAAPEIVVVS